MYKVIVELDGLEAIQLIQIPPRSGANNALVQGIRGMMQQNWDVKTMHVYQEGNALASSDFGQLFRLGLFLLSSDEALQPLNDDLNGLALFKMILVLRDILMCLNKYSQLL
ncbi:hypothetical protein PVK06_003718 [Gossypium arboreum]|uniref:Uncharacterized protein n=1 Tax=Gossypium arboreum TaxID=29729 RepID=A0ABR0QR88_GOSAR|nr:hypothetical protein PVK06_003718 [Gossypium arboreum]